MDTVAASGGGAKANPYRVLLAQGTFYTASLQVSSVSAVLPFICGQQGLLWAAGLLYPAYSTGTIIGNALAPAVIHWSRHLRHFVLAGSATLLAVLIGSNAVVAQTGVLMAAVFLVTSCATGITNAVSKVAASDIVSSRISDVRRGDLLLSQGAVGALIAIAATLLVAPLLAGRDPVAGHVDLLWLGSAGMAVAAIFAVFVGPNEYKTDEFPARKIRHIYRQGLVVARSHQWYRRYTLSQLSFVPISLGTTFYSLHASELHADESGSLHVLVAFTSLGLVVGSALWRIVYRRYGARGMLLGSASLGSTAALICLVAGVEGMWSEVWVHGVVFLLATVSNQAIFTAALAWMNAYAPDHHRAILLGFGSLLVAVGSVLLGAVLGVLAENASTIWPVSIMLALNLIAARAAFFAPARDDGH